jgi:AcrR family transcriptional regulator
MAPKRKKDDTPTKERIMLAAVKEFARAGFHGARIDEIARISGANKAMIYYHFKNKEGLYTALALDVFGQIFDRVKEDAKINLPANEKVYAIARTLSGFMDELDDDFRKIILWEIASGGKMIRKVFAPKFIKPILSIIGKTYGQGIKQGTIRKLDPIYTHLTIVGSIAFIYMARMIVRESVAGKIFIPKDFNKRFTENLLEILQHGIVPDAGKE